MPKKPRTPTTPHLEIVEKSETTSEPEPAADLEAEVARLKKQAAKVEKEHRQGVSTLSVEIDEARAELRRQRKVNQELTSRLWIVGVVAAAVGLLIGLMRPRR